MGLKALLHCAIFRGTCLAAPLRDKLHQPLPDVTYLATAKNTAKPVAQTVAESRIKFYFPQRLSIAQCNICPAACIATVCMENCTV